MLEKYKSKRDFRKTTEPSGRKRADRRAPFFVVQKHDASRLHYDFRFLHNGVLASWAVPKGPSLNPSDKRLAIRTEDHPVDYADFEGVIPKGEYGAGEVIVWDRGRFKAEDDVESGLEEGKLRFDLNGEKLHGGFELVRMKGKDDAEQWLLIKRRDSHAESGSKTDGITERRPESIKSHRLIGELKESPEADAGKKAPLTTDIRPMLPTLVDAAPDSAGWLHEIKWDGYRLMAIRRKGHLRLLTRNGNDWTSRFNPLAEALDALDGGDYLLDGEAVVLDTKGRSGFQLLQSWLKNGDGSLHYYAFDLLYFDGRDLRDLPLHQRKAMLRDWLKKYDGLVRYSDHYEGAGSQLLERACHENLEGIVSKRRDSIYSSGRTRQWLKTKCSRREEFVVIGYTRPGGSRKHLGSLLLAAHNEDGLLQYAGKVGTGFSQDELERLGSTLSRLERKTSPLQAKDPPPPSGVKWVTPKLVAEITYTEKTDDGLLRHPAYLGLRSDKAADEVTFDEVKAQAVEDVIKPEELEPEGDVLGVAITHASRVIDESSSATKKDLVRYYVKAGKVMQVFIKERPLALLRCPRGLSKECFFQKHFETYVPDEIEVVQLEEKAGRAPYAYVKNPAGLVALAQHGVVELHAWGSRVDRPDQPDLLVFDLDPGEKVPWEEVLGAGFLIRDMLAKADLKAYAKLTGGKGLHVCVPLRRGTGWDEAKAFCRRFAKAVEQQNPDRFISKASKSARKGRIYIDYLRNGFGATAVAPFSVRARPGLPVAVPVSWNELSPDLKPDHFHLGNVDERLRRSIARVWPGFIKPKQSLSKKRLDHY